MSGRSNQSVQIICKTQNHIVESFGSPLPVLVTEALTFVDRNTAVSVNISADGWAWLVCGRRLLVWQYKTTIHDPKQRRAFKSQCRELLLPQSDLAHKAECIAVWLPLGHQVIKIQYYHVVFRSCLFLVVCTHLITHRCLVVWLSLPKVLYASGLASRTKDPP